MAVVYWEIMLCTNQRLALKVSRRNSELDCYHVTHHVVANAVFRTVFTQGKQTANSIHFFIHTYFFTNLCSPVCLSPSLSPPTFLFLSPSQPSGCAPHSCHGNDIVSHLCNVMSYQVSLGRVSLFYFTRHLVSLGLLLENLVPERRAVNAPTAKCKSSSVRSM